jgi:hypothetical protein
MGKLSVRCEFVEGSSNKFWECAGDWMELHETTNFAFSSQYSLRFYFFPHDELNHFAVFALQIFGWMNLQDLATVCNSCNVVDV